MKKIVIIGAGGFGREVEWLIERINENNPTWELIGYVDDNVEIGKKVGNSKVICNTKELLSHSDLSVAIAIGNSKIREKMFDKIKSNTRLSFPNLIDPTVICGNNKFGMGNIICARTILTVNIELGDFNIINLNCTLGHDDIIHNFITIYPNVNVSGNVTIENRVEIGTGTQIIQQKNICSDVVIGASAFIVKDITETGTYIGIPAKKLLKR